MYTRYHVDMSVEDRIGVLAEIAKIFTNHGISLRTVRQHQGEDHARLILVTHTAREKDLEDVVEELKQLEAVRGIESVIRLEE